MSAMCSMPEHRDHTRCAALADEILDVPLEKVQVISEDMGGGFGTKAGNYPEHTLVLGFAELGGKPVKWVSDRTEVLLTDNRRGTMSPMPSLVSMKMGSFLVSGSNKGQSGGLLRTDRLAFPAITHIGNFIRSLHNRCDPRRSDAPAHQHQSDGTLSGAACPKRPMFWNAWSTWLHRKWALTELNCAGATIFCKRSALQNRVHVHL